MKDVNVAIYNDVNEALVTYQKRRLIKLATLLRTSKRI